MSKVIVMLVKFAKVFVCFLILMLSPAVIIAAEEPASGNPAADTAAENPNLTAAPIEVAPMASSEEANTPVAPAAAPITITPAAPAPTADIADSIFNANKNDDSARRAPSVSISEISNAIDKDYSFLYDPNMKPELIKDMADNPNNYVVMYLETGDAILIKLREDLAPNTVIRFRQLVKDKYYDDMEIFRAIPDFIAQMGDPSGSGFGGKGVFYFAEINPDAKFVRGTVAMSNNGNLQSDDTQFFISFNSFSWLDGKYTIFGEVVLGMPRLESINKSLTNNGFITSPAIVSKMELLSDRPADRIDDLSVLIPADKKEQAIKTQQAAQKIEQNKQQVLIETEQQQQAVAAANAAENQANAAAADTGTTAGDAAQNIINNEDASIEEQATEQDGSYNPYLRPHGK
ncbi:MAG: peptidylprolyl isomerase [Alphaproteobacteria bacterium]|nr:peptidylprolyl isomerase [Alphaproteobacteria bacterium]